MAEGWRYRKKGERWMQMDVDVDVDVQVLEGVERRVGPWPCSDKGHLQS